MASHVRLAQSRSSQAGPAWPGGTRAGGWPGTCDSASRWGTAALRWVPGTWGPGDMQIEEVAQAWRLTRGKACMWPLLCVALLSPDPGQGRSSGAGPCQLGYGRRFSRKVAEAQTGFPPGQHAGEGGREACTCSGPRGLGFGPRKSLRTFDCPTWRRSRAGPRVAVLTGKSALAFLSGSHGPGKAAALVSGPVLPRGPRRRARLLVAHEGSQASPAPPPPHAQPAAWAPGSAIFPWHLSPLSPWLPRHRVSCCSASLAEPGQVGGAGPLGPGGPWPRVHPAVTAVVNVPFASVVPEANLLP